MRIRRLLFYFFVGVLIGGCSAFSFAETKPATASTSYSSAFWATSTDWCGAGLGFPSLPSSPHSCVSVETYTTPGCNRTRHWCNTSASGTGAYFAISGTTYTCESGWTLQGTECFREGCPEGQTQQPDGSCQSPCQAGLVGTFQTTLALDTTGQGNNTDCQGQCEVTKVPQMSLNNDDLYVVIDAAGKKYYSGWMTITKTGNLCPAGGSPNPSPDIPPLPEPKKKPPCASGEGVLTTQSGGVKCVPEGTPEAPKPKVEKKKKTETFDDGSTKTTEETKTTDTRSGASHTGTTVTTTPASNGQPGTAGQPGTNTGETGETSDCEGDDCDGEKPGKFAEYGTLYEKKYPDGVTGVLTEKVAAMKATPIGSLANQLAPTTLPSTGACPSFSFGSNIGPGMPFGAGSFAPPCYVWDFIRVVFLISSLLLARRLIFGG